MKQLLKICLILLLCLMSTSAMATNLRGRVDAKPAYASAPFPARGVIVEIYQQVSVDGRFARVSSTVSGVDGLYYFSGIPPGNYFLQVARKVNYRLIVGPGPYQDIAPILLTN